MLKSGGLKNLLAALILLIVFCCAVNRSAAFATDPGTGTAADPGSAQQQPVSSAAQSSPTIQPQSAPQSTPQPQVKPQVAPQPAPTKPAPSPNPALPSTPAPTPALPATATAAQTPVPEQPQSSGNNSILAWLLGFGGAVILGVLITLHFKKKTSDQNQDKQGPCDAIKASLEQKNAELRAAENEFSLKESLVESLKDKIEEAAVDKIGELHEAAEIAGTLYENYQDLQEKYDQAVQILELLRAKKAKLSGETAALQASYDQCVLKNLSFYGARNTVDKITVKMREVDRTIVSAIILSKDRKILMGRKDPTKGGVWPDAWHIPGGGVDEGETLEQALAREVKEEVGLDVSKYKVKPLNRTFTGATEKTLKKTGEKVLCHMLFHHFEIQLDQDAADVPLHLSDDLVETHWFTLEELPNVKQIPGSKEWYQEMGYIPK